MELLGGHYSIVLAGSSIQHAQHIANPCSTAVSSHAGWRMGPGFMAIQEAGQMDRDQPSLQGVISLPTCVLLSLSRLSVLAS